MEFDIHGTMKVLNVINPTDGIGSGGTVNGEVIDTLQNEQFLALEYVISNGTIATGDFSVVLEESDTGAFGGEETVVPAADVVGVSPTWIVTDDDQIRRVGVVGKKRYQRLTLIGANTPVGAFAAFAILGHPKSEPVADQSTTS